MSTWRKLLLGFSKFFLVISLLLAICLGALFHTLGTPETVKSIVKQSGAYDNAVKTALQQSAQKSQENPEQSEEKSIPFDDPVIQKAFDQAFTPQDLQTYTENVVDGIYNWLDGKVSEPDFKIDLSAKKAVFAQALADAAVVRVNGLPTCTSLPQETDLFSISCKPPGVNIQAEANRFKDKMLSDSKVLPDSITVKDLFKDNEQSFNERFGKVPDAYQKLKVLPPKLFVLSTLLAVAIVFLAKTKRDGIRRVGALLTGSGAFIFIPTVVLGVVLPRIFARLLIKVDAGPAKDILTNILNTASTDFKTSFLLYSGVVMVIGLAIYVPEVLTRPKTQTKDAADVIEDGLDKVEDEEQPEKQESLEKDSASEKKKK